MVPRPELELTPFPFIVLPLLQECIESADRICAALPGTHEVNSSDNGSVIWTRREDNQAAAEDYSQDVGEAGARTQLSGLQ